MRVKPSSGVRGWPVVPGSWICLPALIFLLIFVPAEPAAAQEGTLTGTVRDAETNAPVVDASVEVLGLPEGRSVGSLTGAEGRFRISLPPGTYSLLVSMIGRETVRLDGIRIRAGETEEVDVTMATRAFAMAPMVVTASRREEKVLEAPASVSIVGAEAIRARSAPTTVEHLKGMPGVDIAQTGLQQSNVVTRGFNNVFSGSLLVINDNRYAHVPSLRFNAYNLIPTVDYDVERIEVVRGPGAALYGPNSASGVMHLITSSPLDDPGTMVSVAPGLRSGNETDPDAGSIFHGVFRHASRVSETVGVRVSGQFFTGNDWEYVDPFEATQAEQNPDVPRIGDRNPNAERAGGEVRLDYRPWDDGEVIVSAGANRMMSSVELTGLGAAQAKDWEYRFFQTRVRKGNFFGQIFGNFSDAGDTFLLRTGNDIVDESRMWVAQLQHGFDVGERQSFIYGVDLQRTDPRTGGTITGRHEGDNEIDEVGGYLHSETRLTDRLDLVAALRVDDHNRLPDPNVSPRAAVVYRPAPDQNVRLTFNRAFSTPTTNNLFLDIVAGRIPIPPENPVFGYDIRALGVPPTGFTFDQTCTGGVQGLCMRSPLQQGQLPATAVPFWNSLVNSLVPPALRSFLLNPGAQPDDPELASILRSFDFREAQKPVPDRGALFPADPGGPRAIDRITSTITNTVEVGYKGLVADRLLLSADLYWNDIKDFVGPLRVETPNVFLDPGATQAFVTKRLAPLLQAGVVTPGQAESLIQGLASVPVGTVAPDQSDAPDLLVTYRNFGDVSLWGLDVGGQLMATDRLTLSGSYSFVSEECFDFSGDGTCRSAEDVSLNAAKNKGSLGVEYRDRALGLTVDARARFVEGFLMNSGVYVGDVSGYGLLDANVSYRLRQLPGTTVTLTGTNLLDNLHQQFVGAPQLGRMLLLRLQYEF